MLLPGHWKGAKVTSTNDKTSVQLERLSRALDEATCVVVGAGAGLSAAAGFDYSGLRFSAWCKPWEDAFGVHDFYSAGFYDYPTCEDFWGYWSTAILANRYECGVGKVYRDLRSLLAQKDYFVLTTNVDHQFQLAGFDRRRLFYTQGDYGLFQCSEPCCQETFDNEQQVRAMHKSIRGTAIDPALVPRCPHCGRELTTNLRCDEHFVEDAGWHAAAQCYSEFLRRHEGCRTLFLELGVGYNTPGIIKYPFWQMTSKNPRATYACVNLGQAGTRPYIKDRSITMDADISLVVSELLARRGGGTLL